MTEAMNTLANPAAGGNSLGWHASCGAAVTPAGAPASSVALAASMDLIPTARKEKLPKGFSYPLGAKAICEALNAIPQAENARLWFEWRDEYWASKWQKRLAARGSITLFHIAYAEYFGYWDIRVYSVPSEYSVSARQYLLTALERVRGELLAAGIESRHHHATVKLSLSEAERPANPFAGGNDLGSHARC